MGPVQFNDESVKLTINDKTVGATPIVIAKSEYRRKMFLKAQLNEEGNWRNIRLTLETDPALKVRVLSLDPSLWSSPRAGVIEASPPSFLGGLSKTKTWLLLLDVESPPPGLNRCRYKIVSDQGQCEGTFDLRFE
jgi:hypothetical protein